MQLLTVKLLTKLLHLKRPERNIDFPLEVHNNNTITT